MRWKIRRLKLSSADPIDLKVALIEISFGDVYFHMDNLTLEKRMTNSCLLVFNG